VAVSVKDESIDTHGMQCLSSTVHFHNASPGSERQSEGIIRTHSPCTQPRCGARARRDGIRNSVLHPALCILYYSERAAAAITLPPVIP
jgi:hypothetical protein